MPSNQQMQSAKDVMSLSRYLSRDGEVRSTPGFLAVNRIRKLIKTVGRRGMITVSELIDADPTLAGLERPEILNQIIGYGKFDIMEMGEDIYVTTDMRPAAVQVRDVPRLKRLFVEARAGAGDTPLLGEVQAHGRQVAEVAETMGISLKRLVGRIGRELDRLEAVNGVVTEIRNECAAYLGQDEIHVTKVKAALPELAWITPSLLACIIVSDGAGREIRLTGTVNRRLIVAKAMPRATVRTIREEPDTSPASPESHVPAAVIASGPSARQEEHGQGRRRSLRRESLRRRIFKVPERVTGRVRPVASWQKRRLRPVR